MFETRDQTNMLFLGNYDNGIIVPRQGEISSLVIGALARKCIDVSPRAAHYLGPSDAALLYEPLSPEFKEYFRSLYGHEPVVFAPRGINRDSEEPLSLLKATLSDPDLLRTLSTQGQELGWQISPFIQHPLVLELAERLGLPVADADRDFVMQGRVAHLNDKGEFTKACRHLEIPTVPGANLAHGLGKILEIAEYIYTQRGAVILRHSMSAGGLGNIHVTNGLIAKSGYQDLRSYLLSKMTPKDMWDTDTVLVEPVLDLKYSPATLVKITPDGVKLISHSLQIVKGCSYIGSIAPSGLEPRELGAIIGMTKTCASYLKDRYGARGYCGFDWGVTKDGKIVAFECNFRYGGMVHVSVIRQRLRPDYNGVVTFSNDSLKIGREATLCDICQIMDKEGLSWNRATGQGAVVVMPPKGGSMGYIVLADTFADAERLNQRMLDMGESTRH